MGNLIDTLDRSIGLLTERAIILRDTTFDGADRAEVIDNTDIIDINTGNDDIVWYIAALFAEAYDMTDEEWLQNHTVNITNDLLIQSNGIAVARAIFIEVAEYSGDDEMAWFTDIVAIIGADAKLIVNALHDSIINSDFFNQAVHDAFLAIYGNDMEILQQ